MRLSWIYGQWSLIPPKSISQHNIMLQTLMTVILLIAIYSIEYIAQSNHNIPLVSNEMIVSNNRDMGLVICVGNKHRIDAIRMIYHLRHVWKVTLPLVLSHCNELLPDFQQLLTDYDPNLRIHNLCPENVDNIYGMNRQMAEKKLKGFFCKVAALIESPFEETMILDLDTIWFKNPERMFHSKAYLKNKSLFFRDRLYDYEIHGGRITPYEIIDMYSEQLGDGYHVSLSLLKVLELFVLNGVSLYFANAYNQLYPQFNEHQDSSALLLGKREHPKLLQQLTKWLSSFVLGYGDKEIFWVASTMVEEPFTWLPFLAGQYGDCWGLILQFDPDEDMALMNLINNNNNIIDTFINNSTHQDQAFISQVNINVTSLVDNLSIQNIYQTYMHVSPVYMNAEYLIEKELKIVGEFLHHVMTRPILAVEAIYNLSTIQSMNSFSDYREKSGCTCGKYDCLPVKKHVNTHILLSQWMILSLRLQDKHINNMKDIHEDFCIPIYIQYIDTVNRIFQEKLSRKDCPLIGCPYFPMNYNQTLYHSHSLIQKKKSICEPVTFSVVQDDRLLARAIKAREALTE